MRVWQVLIITSAAAVAGFSAGHQWQSALPTNVPSVMPVPVVAAPASTVEHRALNTQAVASELMRQLSPTIEALVNNAVTASTENNRTASRQSPAGNAYPGAAPPKDPAVSQQAFEQVAALLTDQIHSGQWQPEQREAMSAAAPKLTRAQRSLLMDRFIGAKNRGEIDHSVEPPPF